MIESTLSQNSSNTKVGGKRERRRRLEWGEADAMNAEPVTDLEKEEHLEPELERKSQLQLQNSTDTQYLLNKPPKPQGSHLHVDTESPSIIMVALYLKALGVHLCVDHK